MTAPIIYSIGVPSPITPAEPLPSLPEIPRGSLVIVEGRAPIWRYGMALHLLHASPAAAIAFYDPRLGAVIVASHSPAWQVGLVVDITIPESK
ncbi:MAG: CRISPR-associated protein Csx3 [Methanotrichaceae archaeon]|nr:CRISPR-associated protein Csx3 [Methanotrichaceae archaeon]